VAARGRRWLKSIHEDRPHHRLALDSTLVRIDSDDGLAGWGEGCPWGHTYLPAFGGGIRAALELLAPVLVGRDPRDIDALNRAMDLALPGHPYAKSPLDIALWDILGQSAGLPLYALFGGAAGGSVPDWLGPPLATYP
jgi:L-alanine-DL-glutamate epimerase-like enolase superfamily enzyme